jgi:hypothetical protein
MENTFKKRTFHAIHIKRIVFRTKVTVLARLLVAQSASAVQ